MATTTRVSRAKAAEILGVSPKTLGKWAMLGKGPRFCKFGRSRSSPVRYSLEDLHRFAESWKHSGEQSADEDGQAA
jgi:hypothetical protein